MRKDVKLGFAIGGILLAVLVVYVLAISGNSGGKPEQVALVTADPSVKTAKTPPATAPATAPQDYSSRTGRNRRPQNAAADIAKPAEPVAAAPVKQDRVNQGSGTDPFKSPSPSTKPAVSEAIASNTNASADDRWTTALQTGVPVLMTSTPSTAAPAVSGTPATEARVPSTNPSNRQPSITPIMASNSPNAPAVVPAALVSPVVVPLRAPTTRSSGFSNTESVRAPVVAPVTTDNRATPPAVRTADGRTHMVQSGETFSSIAAVVYGNAAYYPHLVRANPNIDPKKLRAGMSIIVPPASEVRAETPANSAALTATPSASQSPIAQQKLDDKTEYRIESGDSLFKISSKLYGKMDRADKIYEINKSVIGPDKGKLKVGMVLKLPEAPTVK